TRLSHYERIWRVARDIDPHALGLQIISDGVDTALASDARALVAAKWRHVAPGAVGVHQHSSGYHPLRHHQRPPNALRPDAGGEPVYGVIGDANRFLFVVKRNYRKHGTEDLFIRNTHLRIHIGEDGRLHEPARSTFLALRRSASQPAHRAFFFRD